MRLYRFAMWLLLPALIGWTAWQTLRGRFDKGALRERLGRISPTGPKVRRIWLHGASNGELTSVRWLVLRILSDHPDMSMVITCNSASARAMVHGWGQDRVAVQLAPFDTRGAMRRFLAAWQPEALITVENELWPERIAQAAARGPVALVGARISEGSARNWQRLAPGLMQGMLAALRLVSAQDVGSEARFVSLGLPQSTVGPRMMLKSVGAGPAAQALPIVDVPRARCLLAASTHEGEDALILDAYLSARAAGVFDLLILAPRHPRRAPAIAALIAARGLHFATRSAGEVPGAETAVYLADTLGEMALWYGMAGATVIGGTFGDAGGHTPYEPAAQGSALLHGPSVANFTESFAALDAAGAAIAVADGAGLTAALCAITPADQTRLAAAAQVVLPSGGEAALIAALEKLLR